MKSEIGAGDPVVVTTTHRGVFFGEVIALGDRTITLRDAQNCLRWHESVRGFLGLAAGGPKPGSRVGPPAPILALSDVTSVALCAPEAVEAWKAQPWK